MRRKLFNFAAAVSLVLCMGTAVLWALSYRAASVFVHDDGTWTQSLGSTEGRLYLTSTEPFLRSGALRWQWQQGPPFTLQPRQPLPGEPGVRHHGILLGVFWYITDGGPTHDNSWGPMHQPLYFDAFRMVSVPLWLAAAAFSLLPASWLADSRRRRDGPGPRCPVCSYNLTGNTSGICPECGTPIADKPVVKA